MTPKTTSLKILTGLAATLVLLTLAIGAAPKAQGFGIDFVQYWAGGRALLNKQNPYSAEIISAFEIPAKIPGDLVIRLWNPPTIFLPTLPFSLLPYQTGLILWVGCGILISAAAIFSLIGFWRSENSRDRILAIICCGTSFALSSNIYFGQSSHLVLAGLTIFLCELSRTANRGGFWAGFYLSLSLIKPHLLGLLYIYLLIKALVERRGQTLLGITLGGACLAFIPMAFSPDIISQYLSDGTKFPINWKTPTLGSFLQGALDSHTILIRSAPFLVAAAATVIILIKKPALLKLEALPAALLPFSLLFSPYGWIYDQLALLPAVALNSLQSRKKAATILAANIIMSSPISGATQAGGIWYTILIAILSAESLMREIRGNNITPRPESRLAAA